MSLKGPARIFIQEVVTRDGLQIEPNWVPTADKVALIDGLSRTGVHKIEVSSFVSPRAVPNLRDAKEVFRLIDRNPAVTYGSNTPRGEPDCDHDDRVPLCVRRRRRPDMPPRR